MSPNGSVYLIPQRKLVNTVSIRIREQQQHLLEQSFTSYLREFENTSLTRSDIFQKFQNDVVKNLRRLNLDKDYPLHNKLDSEDIPIETYNEESIEFTLHEIDFCY